MGTYFHELSVDGVGIRNFERRNEFDRDQNF